MVIEPGGTSGLRAGPKSDMRLAGSSHNLGRSDATGRKNSVECRVPQPTAKKTVLIVEDDRAVRELYRNVLRQAGYEVGAVEDGTDALRRIEHWTPDVASSTWRFRALTVATCATNGGHGRRPATSRSSS